MAEQQDYVVIVAGGKGLRMGADVPKQFLPLKGKPVLMHTIERFHRYAPQLNIIVVLPREQQGYWQELCSRHNFAIPHTLADGGATRFDSSVSGLKHIPDDARGVVAIHDGVRPFVSEAVIGRCYDTARRQKAAIPVMPVVETLRKTEPDGRGRNVMRDEYRMVQTPQAFDIQLAKQAFRQPYSPSFTDDASVVESLGHRVAMVEGNRENIKLTTPFDLLVAEKVLAV